MGRGGVVRLGDRCDARVGVELGDAFQSERRSPHKGSGTEECERGPKANTEPGRGAKGWQPD